ncbi:MAG: hypothetical protein CSB44_04195 [Gammaproteobacteria bacterium]|nr:MAG: hypothetical protein CSB44_04195 [Gammaproteobacteria bacterium]
MCSNATNTTSNDWARIHRAASVGILGLAALAFLPCSERAEATIYKCVDADGNTSYTSRTCPANDTLSTLTINGTSSWSQDCRVGRDFGDEVIRKMQAGMDSTDVFATWGGIDAVSPTVINMVSYIYTFRGSDRIDAARISALTHQRCESGSFGQSDCRQFPSSFVRNNGGCHADAGPPANAVPVDSGSIAGELPRAERDPNRAALDPKPQARDPAVADAEIAAADAQAAREACRIEIQTRMTELHRNSASATGELPMSAIDEMAKLIAELGRC